MLEVRWKVFLFQEEYILFWKIGERIGKGMMSEQVKDGFFDRLRRDVYEGYYGVDVEEDKLNVELENLLDIIGKDYCGQKGNKRILRISRDVEEDGKIEDFCGVGNSL